MRRYVAPAVTGLLSVGGLVVAWQLYITVNPSYRVVISSPSRVLDRALEMWSTAAFWTDVSVTMREVLLGLVLGSGSGIAVTLLMMTFPRMARTAQAVAVGVNSVPKLALAPILIVWLGIGATPKIVLMWLVVFIVFVLNLYPALAQTRTDWKSRFRVLGASQLQLYRWLYVPGSVPVILTSLRFSIGVGLRAVIFAEFLGAAAGLGYLITYYGNTLNMDGLMVTLVAILCIGLTLELAVAFVERRASRWRVDR